LEKHYTSCPVCGSADLHYKLKALDQTVSKKEFEIWQCSNCTLRLTQDVPDINSIGQYYQSDNYISHTNTKKGLINSLYHLVRELTLSNKRRLILSLTGLKNGKLLDVGAGTGSFAGFMKKHGWNVTGLEPDEQARQQAQTINNIQLIGPENFYLLPEESFDVITMWHVLEHVHDLHDYLTQLKKLIKPQGKIFIAVPNYTSFDASFYKNYWAAYDVPRHLYHFSPLSLKKLFNEHDFELQSTRAMPYDSFYISFLSERYKKNKLGLLRGFLIGLYSNLIAFVNKERCSSLIYIINK
jgi:2-polyprenyl-3-methyl-5-hydroxy-6-metoxy-1,4-benzoquinol methylase